MVGASQTENISQKDKIMKHIDIQINDKEDPTFENETMIAVRSNNLKITPLLALMSSSPKLKLEHHLT